MHKKEIIIFKKAYELALEIFKVNLKMWQESIKEGRLDTAKLGQKIKGWVGYARYANSYKLRKVLLSKGFVTKK